MAGHDELPELRVDDLAATRDALHATAGVLGGWLKHCRPHRRHWWHASLRPSLRGLTTGVVLAAPDFELELDLRTSRLRGRTADGQELSEPLDGRPTSVLAGAIAEFLLGAGFPRESLPDTVPDDTDRRDGYSAEQSARMASALRFVAARLQDLRARLREEASPIQVWPHHFDMSMLWLPGELIPGEDPVDEEQSDKQMNFGFVFGDGTVGEPYFYITAYPRPDALLETPLPAGTRWRTDGFDGAVLTYETLRASDDPGAYLMDVWTRLLSAAREHMIDGNREASE